MPVFAAKMPKTIALSMIRSKMVSCIANLLLSKRVFARRRYLRLFVHDYRAVYGLSLARG